ncbi:hypothetical protein Back11_45600 [Paenibacillus baekrokdamisoli]|uniref:Uncharacterized protein n=1 Tax=Paenibacillus baekrokdamisoli TaxID=1712516 RepID=A0A3G9J4F2_9BACL|nr:S-layer homology domain-containing protein [Paenibacillus baekrokdamisoli]MBB3072345.1 hypothetical protein [Paenibacillus baekrokdamisoli]BBH23215.1 hypothetical protein Back11_45600 [Paenibacillus baekrokdamisoli]
MSAIRRRALRALSSLIALTLIFSSFSGMVFAIAVDGTAAEAISQPISNFDYSGGNAKTFTIGDGSGHTATITLDKSLNSIQEVVDTINASLLADTGNEITATEISSTNTFRLTSSVIGKHSLITISGSDAAGFFAKAQYNGTATDAESVAETKEILAPLYDADDSLGWVTGNMRLPVSDVNGTSISWSSDNTDFIENNGIVKRPTNNTIVTLTATITKGSASGTQTFAVTVIGTKPTVVITDSEAVANTAAGLTPIYDTDESEGYVKGRILLRLLDEINGTIISWSSSNPAIITTTITTTDGITTPAGTVIRQSATTPVTLTATVTKNGKSKEVSFTVSVIGIDSERINTEKAALYPTYASGDSESSVTQDLQLPPGTPNDVSIKWGSSNTTYLGTDGKVTRPNFADGPADVVLTATLTKGAAVDTKSFHIKILPKAETDLEAVTYAKSHIVVGYAAGDSVSHVTGNLTLDTNGAHGSAVTWSSNNPTVISNAGVVNRPTGADAVVTLTATVTKGVEKDTAAFTLTVKGIEPTVIPVYTPPTPAFEMTSATKSLIESLGTSFIVAPVETSTNSTGDTITKVKQADLLKQMNSTDAKAVIIPVANTKGKSVVSLTPGLLADLKQKDVQSKVVIQSNGVTYEIPAALADTSAIVKALGLSDAVAKDAELQISIEIVPSATVQEQITNAGGTLVASVVSFSISVVTPNKTYDFNDFRGTYINRSFNLNKSVDSTNAVGVVINSDGSVTPVPTIFTTIDGKSVATLKADHNSTYTIIEHTSTLSDIGTSWAKDKIKILANKKIINGYEDGTFKPNGDVTRAEFAFIIAKGLGLNADSSAIKFSDVSKEAWYAGVVGAMSSRGFISGYVDGSFKADQKITREEEAIILGRVLTYLNKDVKPSLSVLDKFRDRTSISEYAKSSVAALVELKIINGNTQGNLDPQGFATRAETATMIYNLLSLMKFLN